MLIVDATVASIVVVAIVVAIGAVVVAAVHGGREAGNTHGRICTAAVCGGKCVSRAVACVDPGQSRQLRVNGVLGL